MQPTVEKFRALARSSPWRWSSLRFVLSRSGHRESSVRAWLRRPDVVRVEDLDGSLLRVVHEAPRTVSHLTSDGRGEERRLPPARSFRPETDEDGLVVRRPDRLRGDFDDPMYDSYHWVAMLDPVELADGSDPEDGSEVPGAIIQDVALVEHEGRPALQAMARPTDAYDPRCRCCTLIPGDVPAIRILEQKAPFARPEGFTYPDGHLVRLDTQTGVLVHARQVGGSRDGWTHSVAIEEVDGPMPDDLFPAWSPPGRSPLSRLLHR